MDFNRYSVGLHKLIYHTQHIQNICDSKTVAPIHVSIWPTIKCQCNCSYCCCKNIKDKTKELSLDDFKLAINILSKYGCKAIEFSGGGEPLLWPHIEEAIDYASNKKLKISLITNGLSLCNISKNSLSKLAWIRISLQSLSHVNNLKLSNIPENINISTSYIIGNVEKLDIIDNLYIWAKEKNIIVRIAAQRPSTLERESDINAYVSKYLDFIFFSKKATGQPLGCYMAWIRAAIDWNGNFLPCPSIQLTPEYEGYIPSKFNLCKIKDLEQWLLNNPPHDLKYNCSFCNCGKEHNDFIHNLLKGVKDVEFV